MKLIYNHFINRRTKSTIFYRTLLIFSLAFISSCSHDFLVKTPLSSYTDAAIWEDANLIGLFVNNTYEVMSTGFTDRAVKLSGVTDECWRRGAGNDFINLGDMTPSQVGLLEFWTNGRSCSYWTPITQCNIFLSKIDNSPVEITLKNRMKGEITFLRAYAYFRLVAFYGGVPIIKTPFQLTDNFNIARNTYDDCMNFVISEFDAAAALLPLTYTSSDLGRITKGAALAAKSRALLYVASPLNNPTNSSTKWQAAADAAKAVIDLNQYSLFPDYKSQFLKANSYNSEAIWSRPYNQLVTPEGVDVEQSEYPNGYNGYGQLNPYQNLVDQYEMTSGKLPKDDPSYDSQNPYVNRDPRFYATILYDGAPFQGRAVETFLPGGQDSSDGTNAGYNATSTGYYLRKFIDEDIVNPNSNNQGDSPWIFFRYAEILLNYAKAEYFLGDETTCKQYLNMIRSRPSVNMPPITESGSALLTRLQHERQIELVFEEHRWFDVRRWQIAPVALNTVPLRMDIVKDPTTGIKTYTVNAMPTFSFVFGTKDYLLPIPQTEIAKNSSLVQNPGY